MSVEKWWSEICGRGKRDKSRENPFRPARISHGVTRTKDPSGERRACNQGAACVTLIHGRARVAHCVTGR